MAPEKGGGITGKNNPMLSENSLPKLIRWYKGRCSFEMVKKGARLEKLRYKEEELKILKISS
jgi:hypothetical protein